MFQEDLRRREAESFQDAWAEGVYEDIGCGEDVEEEFARRCIAEVDGDGCLATGQLVVGDRVGAIDAEDRGAVVGEEKTGEGPWCSG